MRIVVFSPDVPFPPNRGGRADIWRRILAFKALGHAVMLVNLHEPDGPTAPTAAHLQAIDATVDARFSFPMKRGPGRTLRQLALSWWTPWHAATRIPEPAERKVLDATITGFQPDLLWLDGPWFGPLGLALAAQCRLPLAYRSHNVEHTYLWGQAAAAVRWRDQVAWRLACIGVERLQLRLMQRACAVFDISRDDLAYWAAQGVQRLHWLPPLPELALVRDRPAPIAGEVLFLGNLRTPNNMRGVQFLLQAVWPRVRQQLPMARLRVVGSNPAPEVPAWIGACPGAELQRDVPDPLAYLLGARVLVNPVMTGSGVQLKTLDMLMTDAPVVSTTQGLRGLPAETEQAVWVADTADAFAQSICDALREGITPAQAPQRAALRTRFGVRGLAEALASAGLPLPDP